MSQVLDATVLAVRPVTVDGSQSGLGATAGAVAGGVALAAAEPAARTHVIIQISEVLIL